MLTRTFSCIFLIFDHAMDATQISVLRERESSDIFFGISPCGANAKALNGSGCQCEHPFNTFYEIQKGRYCSRFWSVNTKEETIVSYKGKPINSKIWIIYEEYFLVTVQCDNISNFK